MTPCCIGYQLPGALLLLVGVGWSSLFPLSVPSFVRGKRTKIDLSSLWPYGRLRYLPYHTYIHICKYICNGKAYQEERRGQPLLGCPPGCKHTRTWSSTRSCTVDRVGALWFHSIVRVWVPLKPNSSTYNSVEVSGLNLEISQRFLYDFLKP